MPKKISKSQIIGYRGEVQFEDFALKHGLLPQPTSRDHGIDFICQRTQLLTKSYEVLASCILVNVKANGVRVSRVPPPPFMLGLHLS